MSFRFLRFASFILSITAGTAAAQSYPTKPVRMIVSGAAGGTTDILAHLLAPKLQEALGGPVVVEIRAGAGGNIGAEMVAKSPPDGHTLLIVYPAFTTNPTFYGNLNFDTEKDFAPVTLLVEIPVVLVTNPSVPANTLQELIALAKTRPGRLNFGSSGNGGVGHLVGEAFNSAAGVRMVHVPYKGNGPALVDVMTGVLSLTFSDLAGALPYVKQGKMRAIALASARRSPKLPDTPTMSEAGLPGFQASSWYGIVVTAGTPQPVINRLNEEFTRILRAPEMRDRLTDLAFDVVGSSQQEFAAFLRSEIVKWTKVIKESGASIKSSGGV